MKTKLKSIITLFVVLMVQITFAQERTISGVVSDDMGPVADISVKVKGTDRGTVTDFDGNYTIKAKTGDVLEFSHVSYGTIEKIVGATSKMDITMSSKGTDLDVVIVSGVAGATSKKKMSVSVASVKAKDINKVTTSSVANALQGKVAGVSITNTGKPGSGATIILRGAANFYGSQSPLVIMDGVFVEGGLGDINVDDIASMEIVKGASASSFYGSKAGNGVIVIKTKRGRVDKTDVTIRSEIGFSKITNFIDTNQSHSYDLASDWENYKGQYTKFDGVTYPENYQGVFAAGGPNAVVGQPTQSTDHYSDNPYGVYYDVQKQLFKTGLDQVLYGSVASGTDKASLFISAENHKNDGVLKEAEGYTRNSIRANIDVNANKWLKFTSSNNFIKINDHSPVGANNFFRTITRLSPEANLLASNPDGQPYYYTPEPNDSEISNPLYDLYTRNATTKEQRFLGSYNMNVKFADWVNADVEYSFENDNTDYLSSHKYETYVTSGDEIGFGYSKGDLYNDVNSQLSQKFQTSLNFRKAFGDLDFTGKISYLLEAYNSKQQVINANDFKYPGIISFDNFDPAAVNASTNEEIERAKDIFAIAGFVYKDRYIFDALYRNDQSSLFGANYRNNSYYRLSGAYRISEDFTIPGVQELKIRAAIGTAGQRPGFVFRYEREELTHGTIGGSHLKGNENLRPSLTTEKEFGLNANFLNRFGLEVTYSNQIVSDQFMKVDLVPVDGYNLQWQNVGDLESNVFEASLNSKIINKENIKWNLGINFTTSNTTITKLNVAKKFVGPDQNNIFLIKEGEEFGSMYGGKFVTDLATMANQLPAGMSIGDYSVNSDGFVVETAKIGTTDEAVFAQVDEDGNPINVKIGNQNADFRVGINSQFSFKNFDFYMLWDWKQGGDIYNKNNQWNTIANRSAIVDQAGKADNEKKTTDYYASLYHVNETYDYWVEDGSFVKLRETSLAYTFKGKALSHIAKGFFKEMKISLIGKNLLTFTKYSGWDPEVTKYDSSTKQYFSVDYGVYPTQTSYSMSFQLKF